MKPLTQIILTVIVTFWLAYTGWTSYQLWIERNLLKPAACFKFNPELKQWEPLK